MSERTDPFDEIERVFDRLSTQFEDVESIGVGGDRLRTDLRDEGDRFVLVADLAGYESEDVAVTLREGRRVEISAERETGTGHDEEGIYVRRERRESVSRTVSLPDPVDESETAATFEDGVLTVTLQKRDPETGDGHSIPVN